MAEIRWTEEAIDGLKIFLTILLPTTQRRLKHSMMRMPIPYTMRKIKPLVPLVCANNSATSDCVNTTGNRVGRLALTISVSHGKSTCNTSLYRNSNALLA
jgi:hypothetical protein